MLGSVLGLFVGPAQAAGRSMMARLAPSGLETEAFGLYELSGKADNLVGPCPGIHNLDVPVAARWHVGLSCCFLSPACLSCCHCAGPVRSNG
ncbi:MFS transporter [Methylocystis hirsuta]|uniref:MFS transporter n=1 Tax=Methylocystis hirsuta TaxID=369798 RepID=UPI003CCAF785